MGHTKNHLRNCLDPSAITWSLSSVLSSLYTCHPDLSPEGRTLCHTPLISFGLSSTPSSASPAHPLFFCLWTWSGLGGLKGKGPRRTTVDSHCKISPSVKWSTSHCPQQKPAVAAISPLTSLATSCPTSSFPGVLGSVPYPLSTIDTKPALASMF
ncbi:homeobox domain-containing protein [Trichonephila clavata]|uniref:Homeobox domain-containing protein n=1 Tax=Trichonephila clavata TaxID=2740835 RepID=A0A8X6L6J2_TRICU|nr:homeobox domain-containing protein [Trichonephila clavata]